MYKVIHTEEVFFGIIPADGFKIVSA